MKKKRRYVRKSNVVGQVVEGVVAIELLRLLR